jgi:membrane protease YdiL (CAAX protease family)
VTKKLESLANVRRLTSKNFKKIKEILYERAKKVKIMKKSKKPFYIYTIGLIIVLVSDFILRNVTLPTYPSDIDIGIALGVEWLILLVLLTFWIPKVENNKLESIGFGKFKRRYLWKGILTYFILLIVWMGSYFVLQAIGLEGLRSLQPTIRKHSFPILFSLFLTGTFLEEIFYRGYLIERLISLTGKSWLAGLVSWIAFTFVHIKFFGLGPTLDVGVLSAGLVILYLKERSIWPCIILHGINDAFGFLMAPLFML